MYRVELCKIGHENPAKLPRYYILKTNGLGEYFKTRIGKARYNGFTRQAIRQECMSTRLRKDAVSYEHLTTCVFDKVPLLF